MSQDNSKCQAPEDWFGAGVYDDPNLCEECHVEPCECPIDMSEAAIARRKDIEMRDAQGQDVLPCWMDGDPCRVLEPYD